MFLYINIGESIAKVRNNRQSTKGWSVNYVKRSIGYNISYYFCNVNENYYLTKYTTT